MKVGIVGLGLIGGSLARTLTEHGHTVYGADRDPDVLKKAFLLNAVQKELTKERAAELDLLVVAVYPRSFLKAAENYLPFLKEGAVLSDVCGNKRMILEAMKELRVRYPKISYVGVHPMAGKEYCGIDRSSAHLFDGASVILVPLCSDGATECLKELFLSIGFGRVVCTDAKNHDGMIAYTSQLCHIVSNAFIKSESAEKHVGYSAGSYKDLTRVARLEPAMWAQLMMDNRDFLTPELTNLIEHLKEYENALKVGDEEELQRLLDEGNRLKKKIDRR